MAGLRFAHRLKSAILYDGISLFQLGLIAGLTDYLTFIGHDNIVLRKLRYRSIRAKKVFNEMKQILSEK